MTKIDKQLRSAANKMQELAVALRNVDMHPDYWNAKILPILRQIESAQLTLAQERNLLAGVVLEKHYRPESTLRSSRA